ncbi:MAG: FkbM family methyltransferase [Spirochaetaceae bacterium]|nr:MAG: FkbM family methyltransferase [Spirochaetaceae bacterium]
MNARLASAVGLTRSFLVYYGIPFRIRTLRRTYTQFLGPGDLAFDVGAHVGNRVLAWLRLGARVIAVEPQPSCVRLLRRLYGRNPRVTIDPRAVSVAPGPVTLYLSARHPTLTTVSDRWVNRASNVEGFSHVRWERTVSVPACTVDDLIARYGMPRFIKVDVEGYEDQVIASLSTPVEALSFEVLTADLDIADRCIDHLERLCSYRYQFSAGESLRIDPSGWVDAAAIRALLRSLPASITSGDVYATRSAHPHGAGSQRG